MGDQTLFTFLLESVPSCSRVELFGSWDNFSTPYPMIRDSRKGPGHWVGCHTFKSIICDGNPEQLTNRDGCLLAGGTYWYFYKRDDYVEFHNKFEPHTTTCPLLPGQAVNVLEIPIEHPITLHGHLPAVGLLSVFTLDPAARRQNPKPWPRSVRRPATTDSQQRKHGSHTNRPHTAAILSQINQMNRQLFSPIANKLSRKKTRTNETWLDPVSKDSSTNTFRGSDEAVSNTAIPGSRCGSRYNREILHQQRQQSSTTSSNSRPSAFKMSKSFNNAAKRTSGAASAPHWTYDSTCYNHFPRCLATAPANLNVYVTTFSHLRKAEDPSPRTCQQAENLKSDSMPSSTITSSEAFGNLVDDRTKTYSHHRWSASSEIRWSQYGIPNFGTDLLSTSLKFDLGGDFSLDLTLPSESSQASVPSTAISSLHSFNECSSQVYTTPSSPEASHEKRGCSRTQASKICHGASVKSNSTRQVVNAIRNTVTGAQHHSRVQQPNLESHLDSNDGSAANQYDNRYASQETITPSTDPGKSFVQFIPEDDDQQGCTPPLPSRKPPPPPPARLPPPPPLLKVATL